jgi:hypothetical protein
MISYSQYRKLNIDASPIGLEYNDEPKIPE